MWGFESYYARKSRVGYQWQGVYLFANRNFWILQHSLPKFGQTSPAPQEQTSPAPQEQTSPKDLMAIFLESQTGLKPGYKTHRDSPWLGRESFPTESGLRSERRLRTYRKYRRRIFGMRVLRSRLKYKMTMRDGFAAFRKREIRGLANNAFLISV